MDMVTDLVYAVVGIAVIITVLVSYTVARCLRWLKGTQDV